MILIQVIPEEFDTHVCYQYVICTEGEDEEQGIYPYLEI